MARRKKRAHTSGKRNDSTKPRWRRGNTYSPAELFMAAVGALLIVLFIGIVVTSLIGE